MGGSEPEDDEFHLEYLLMRQELAGLAGADREFPGNSPKVDEFTRWVSNTTERITSCKDDSLMRLIPLLISCEKSNAMSLDPINDNATEKFHEDTISLVNAIAQIANSPAATPAAQNFAINLMAQFEQNDIHFEHEGEDPVTYRLSEDLSLPDKTQICSRVVALTCSSIIPVTNAVLEAKAKMPTDEEAKLFTDLRQRMEDMKANQSLREGSPTAETSDREHIILPPPPTVTDKSQLPSVLEMLHWVDACGLPKVAQKCTQGSSAEDVAQAVESAAKKELIRYTSDKSRHFDSATKHSLMDFVRRAFAMMGMKIALVNSERTTFLSRDEPKKLDQNKPDYFLSSEQLNDSESSPHTRPEARVATLCKLMLDVREEAKLRQDEDATLPSGKFALARSESEKEMKKAKRKND